MVRRWSVVANSFINARSNIADFAIARGHLLRQRYKVATVKHNSRIVDSSEVRVPLPQYRIDKVQRSSARFLIHSSYHKMCYMSHRIYTDVLMFRQPRPQVRRHVPSTDLIGVVRLFVNCDILGPFVRADVYACNGNENAEFF
jgi:hypothetical protein